VDDDGPRLPFELPDFDGETYERELDHDRLGAQLLRVFTLMKDGVWRTFAEIDAVTHDPQASISARLRDLRKKKFGSYLLEKRRRGEGRRGLWEYRLVKPEPEEGVTHGTVSRDCDSPTDQETAG
jgi:hypothetical protein